VKITKTSKTFTFAHTVHLFTEYKNLPDPGVIKIPVVIFGNKWYQFTVQNSSPLLKSKTLGKSLEGGKTYPPPKTLKS
jgi:hypothetical protein